MANKPFGWLLTADCYGCDPHALNDVSIVYNFLEEAVHALGVSMQAPPIVIRTPGAFQDKAGLSSICFLVESSITCHTLCVKAFVSVDFYTCSTVNRSARKKLIDLVKRFFRPTEVESHLIKRGVKYYEEG